MCYLGEAAFGVAHRRRVIAVDVAEIAVPVDQRVTLGEILRQAHERLVDRHIAVRMEFADDVADHARTLLVCGARVEVELAHRKEQPPVHGLEAIAHIRQRARHDGGERVGEISLAECLGEIDVANGGGRGSGHLVPESERVQARDTAASRPSRSTKRVRAAGSFRPLGWNTRCSQKKPLRRNASRMASRSG